jgi:hypothetical protein
MAEDAKGTAIAARDAAELTAHPLSEAATATPARRFPPATRRAYASHLWASEAWRPKPRRALPAPRAGRSRPRSPTTWPISPGSAPKTLG